MSILGIVLVAFYSLYILSISVLCYASPVVRTYLSMDTTAHVVLNTVVLVAVIFLVVSGVACMTSASECSSLATLVTVVVVVLLTMQLVAAVYVYSQYDSDASFDGVLVHYDDGRKETRSVRVGEVAEFPRGVVPDWIDVKEGVWIEIDVLNQHYEIIVSTRTPKDIYGTVSFASFFSEEIPHDAVIRIRAYDAAHDSHDDATFSRSDDTRHNDNHSPSRSDHTHDDTTPSRSDDSHGTSHDTPSQSNTPSQSQCNTPSHAADNNPPHDAPSQSDTPSHHAAADDNTPSHSVHDSHPSNHDSHTDNTPSPFSLPPAAADPKTSDHAEVSTTPAGSGKQLRMMDRTVIWQKETKTDPAFDTDSESEDEDDEPWAWRSPYNNLYMAPIVPRRNRRSNKYIERPAISSVATLYEHTSEIS